MIPEKWAHHPRVETVGTEGEVKLPENEKVSEALKEKRHKRENIPFYPHSIHFNTQASRDGILHFVNGIGDENPLFTNQEYAKKSKYANIIAPISCPVVLTRWCMKNASLAEVECEEPYRPPTAGV